MQAESIIRELEKDVGGVTADRVYAKIYVHNCEEEYSFVLEILSGDLDKTERLLQDFHDSDGFAYDDDYIEMLKENGIKARKLEYTIKVG